MKHILLLLSFSLSLLTLAQTPKTISYQGVARNATGQPIPNQSIKIKLSLLETATSSNSLYTETHTTTTTGQGLFALQIGAGTVLSGTYLTLDWSNGPKFVKTEIDPAGGDNFTLSSTNPLNAVPFALFAASGTPGPPGPTGPTGSQGVVGPAGSPGVAGATGPAGVNGKTSLVKTTTEAAGVNCTAGGTKIETGIDANGNNILETAEVNTSLTRYICNGQTGPSGPSFANGTTTNQMIYWNGTAWTTLNPGSNGQTLTLCNGTLTWTTGGICPGSLATLTTTTVSSITSTTASSGGNISNDGGSAVTTRGVCWSTSQIPTIALSTKTSDGTGTGSFISSITGLNANTVYYVRAFATNSAGTAYGNQQTLTTTSSNPVDVDGNVYTTVTIGTQVWMKENLKVSKYRNGDTITTNLSDTAWQFATNGAYSIYNNIEANNSIYGKLYNFFAVSDPRGLCPNGWHVPTDNEWTTLEYFLGGPLVAGGALKATSVWFNPNVGATNSSGFTALPGGLNQFGSYSSIGFNGIWWTSTEYFSTRAWNHQMSYFDAGSSRDNSNPKSNGFSVRCLKN